MFNQFPDVLTTAQLQEALPVGKNVLYELIRTKRIKSIRVGRKILIPKNALIDFVKNGIADSAEASSQNGTIVMAGKPEDAEEGLAG